MLQEGERIDNHDKVCAEYYSTLLMMGAYDEEFAFLLNSGKDVCVVCYFAAKKKKKRVGL